MEIYKSYGLLRRPDGRVVVMDSIGQLLQQFWKGYRFDCSAVPIRRLWENEPVQMDAETARLWIDDGAPLACVKEALNNLSVRWSY